MLVFYLCLFLSDEVKPLSTWQVSFRPEIALVNGVGETILIKGDELFVYTQSGDPKRTATLAFPPESAFVGPDNNVWIYDGRALLGRLNESYNTAWQRNLDPASAPPFNFNGMVVYAAGTNVLLLDPEDGEARFSRRVSNPVTRITALDEYLLISEGSEDGIFAWAPEVGIEQYRYRGKGTLRFAERAPTGELAITYQDGIMEVSQGTASWVRRHYIDINVAPLWLHAMKKPQLITATLGRRVFAYGNMGRILTSVLLPARIFEVIAYSHTKVLIVPDDDELIWYDAEARGFTRVQLSAEIDHVSAHEEFILLVDWDGMIKLYKKP